MGLGIAAFLVKLVLFSQFMSTLPRVPHVDEGRIYPLNQHGTYVYLTRGEHVLMEGLYYGSFFLSLGGCVLLVWRRGA